jgi:hypothetical protein
VRLIVIITRNSLTLIALGKYLDQLALRFILNAPLQVTHGRPVGCFGVAVVVLAVTLDRAVEDLACPGYMQQQVLGGVPGKATEVL